MGWIPDNVIEAMEGSHQLGIFLRVETDPALHVWMGVNDIPIGFDSIDPSGTVYMGGGRLIGVPTLEVLVNGTADSVEFTICGIDPATGQAMLSSIPAVRGCAVHMGLTTLDQYFQPMSDIIPIWNGTASHLGEASQLVTGTQSPSLTLGLTVVSGEPTRSRPARSLWSHAHQSALAEPRPRPILVANWRDFPDGDPRRHLRNPDGSLVPNMVADTDSKFFAGYRDGVPVYEDAFCANTARLARGVQPVWPAFRSG